MRNLEQWKPVRPPTFWFEQMRVERTATEMAKPLIDRRLHGVLNYYPCRTWPLHWHMPWKLEQMTIGQLIRHTEGELLAMKGVGPKTVAEIKNFLAEYGLSLRILSVDDLLDEDALSEHISPSIASRHLPE